MKTKFLVSFWYYTDKRCEAEVEATHHMGAIALAMAKLQLNDWPVASGFFINVGVR